MVLAGPPRRLELPAATPPTSPNDVADTRLCTSVAEAGTCQLEMSNMASIGKH